jgi:hypothetical protein
MRYTNLRLCLFALGYVLVWRAKEERFHAGAQAGNQGWQAREAIA